MLLSKNEGNLMALVEEIVFIRKKMETLYHAKGKVTPEVLNVSRDLDQKIIQYTKLATL